MLCNSGNGEAIHCPIKSLTTGGMDSTRSQICSATLERRINTLPYKVFDHWRHGKHKVTDMLCHSGNREAIHCPIKSLTTGGMESTRSQICSATLEIEKPFIAL